jgi:hypothetical protein
MQASLSIARKFVGELSKHVAIERHCLRLQIAHGAVIFPVWAGHSHIFK